MTEMTMQTVRIFACVFHFFFFFCQSYNLSVHLLWRNRGWDWGGDGWQGESIDTISSVLPAVYSYRSILTKLIFSLQDLADEIDETLTRLGDSLFWPLSELKLSDRSRLSILFRKETLKKWWVGLSSLTTSWTRMPLRFGHPTDREKWWSNDVKVFPSCVSSTGGTFGKIPNGQQKNTWNLWKKKTLPLST